MSTAAAKKNAHIVEYVLYVWQMEDLVRAAQFSETTIEGLFNGEGGACLLYTSPSPRDS